MIIEFVTDQQEVEVEWKNQLETVSGEKNTERTLKEDSYPKWEKQQNSLLISTDVTN